MTDLKQIVMPVDAVALRPVRFMRGDEIRNYTATTFPNDPRGGCDIYYRRCKVFGGIASDNDEAGICDVLDERGNIVADFPLNRRGLKYLCTTLRCLVEA